MLFNQFNIKASQIIIVFKITIDSLAILEQVGL